MLDVASLRLLAVPQQLLARSPFLGRSLDIGFAIEVAAARRRARIVATAVAVATAGELALSTPPSPLLQPGLSRRALLPAPARHRRRWFAIAVAAAPLSLVRPLP